MVSIQNKVRNQPHKSTQKRTRRNSQQPKKEAVVASAAFVALRLLRRCAAYVSYVALNGNGNNALFTNKLKKNKYKKKYTLKCARNGTRRPTKKISVNEISHNLLVFGRPLLAYRYGVFTRSSKRPANFQEMYSKYRC